MMTLKKYTLLLSSVFVLLSGCGQSTEESIHNQLEVAVVLEEDFRAQQSEITELEQREQEIYDEIIGLGTEDMERIIELSDEALAINSERDEMLTIEKESIELAKEAFREIEAYINDLQADVQAIAENMYNTMDARYEAYDDLYNAYGASLDLERELYTLLQTEELEQETLNDQIIKLNESYQEVLTANEQFNTYTNEYNTLRKEFYEAANIQVAITDDVN